MDTIRCETRPCPSCGMAGFVDMPLDAVSAYVNGVPIQNAWREGTPEQREQVITGFHPECWFKLFN